MSGNQDPEPLRRVLAELHAELESAETLDSSLRGQLAAVVDEIHGVLDQTADEGHESERSLADLVSDMALSFELEHPTVAGC